MIRGTEGPGGGDMAKARQQAAVTASVSVQQLVTAESPLCRRREKKAGVRRSAALARYALVAARPQTLGCSRALYGHLIHGDAHFEHVNFEPKCRHRQDLT